LKPDFDTLWSYQRNHSEAVDENSRADAENSAGFQNPVSRDYAAATVDSLFTAGDQSPQHGCREKLRIGFHLGELLDGYKMRRGRLCVEAHGYSP